ncbi:Flagellar biosynthetic protein FlhB OS=Ureibacillus acetophenoni OX=614649 GN=flhB PE=3 SV=1 [Ureibacillus acetophenoni]
MEIYSQALMEMAKIALPILLVAMVIGVAANYFQFGFLFTTEQLKLDLKKMDPIKGIKKIISVRAIVNLIKSLLKVTFIGAVTTMVIWMNLPEVLSLSLHDPWEILTTVASLTGMMGIAASIVLLLIAILDYVYEKV